MPNRSIGCAPFLEAYGHLPKNVMDVNSINSENRTVEEIIDNNKAVYKQVIEALQKNNLKYKELADKHKRFQKFEGELVMVHLKKERFPAGTYSKLKNRNFGPCKILKKVNDNAFIVDLPKEFNMYATFNVADLKKYYPSEYSDEQLRAIAPQEGPPDVAHCNDLQGHWLELARAMAQSL